MEIVSSWFTLMQKAKRLGIARLKGDKAEIAKTERELKDYEIICLQSDKIDLGGPLP